MIWHLEKELRYRVMIVCILVNGSMIYDKGREYYIRRLDIGLRGSGSKENCMVRQLLIISLGQADTRPGNTGSWRGMAIRLEKDYLRYRIGKG